MRITLFIALAGSVAVILGLIRQSSAVRTSAIDLLKAARERKFNLAILYILYGIIAVPCIGLLMPPYQVADEGAHFARADQVSLGTAIGYRSGKNSGGVIDRGVMTSYWNYYSIVLHEDRKFTSELGDQGLKSTWQDGKAYFDFSNTAFYPPYFYTFAAGAISLGKTLKLSVTDTLYLARLLNGLVALGLGALAIAVAGTAAPWFFALLCLPMSLAQAASVSQDALMFPAAAIGAAIAVRFLREQDGNRYDFALMCSLLAMVAAGRVAYGALALIPLVAGVTSRIARALGAASIAVASLGWSWLVATFTLVQFGPPEANAAGQIHYLLTNPAAVLSVAIDTMRYQIALYLESFIGKLGWLDLSLPPLYIELAWAVLAVAALTSATSGNFDGRRRRAAIVVAIALASSTIVLFAALYISWTPVGNFIVDGIQGRYFIPLAFFLPALYSFGAGRPLSRQAQWLDLVVAIFPVVSITVVLLGIVRRYYQV